MVRLTDRLDMTIVVDWDIKTQTINLSQDQILHKMVLNYINPTDVYSRFSVAPFNASFNYTEQDFNKDFYDNANWG